MKQTASNLRRCKTGYVCIIVKPLNQCGAQIVVLDALQIIMESREWFVAIWAPLAPPSLWFLMEALHVNLSFYMCQEKKRVMPNWKNKQSQTW